MFGQTHHRGHLPVAVPTAIRRAFATIHQPPGPRVSTVPDSAVRPDQGRGLCAGEDLQCRQIGQRGLDQAHGGKRQAASSRGRPVDRQQFDLRGFSGGRVVDPTLPTRVDQRRLQPEPRARRRAKACDRLAQTLFAARSRRRSRLFTFRGSGRVEFIDRAGPRWRGPSTYGVGSGLRPNRAFGWLGRGLGARAVLPKRQLAAAREQKAREDNTHRHS